MYIKSNFFYATLQIVIAAALAVAAAEPGIIASHVAYSAPIISHNVAVAAPVAAAPLTVAAPIARFAAPVAIPAPVAYSTGAEITVSAEPVEQHGYKIVY
jgi:hypothetical protein